jgi:ribosomal protein S18 acetylase RimI-like enzyme
VHIVDIALMPGSRDGGIGTAFLSAIQDYARTRGKGVDIFVERMNPAKSLYDRLGFKVVREEEIYLEMDWAPDGVS